MPQNHLDMASRRRASTGVKRAAVVSLLLFALSLWAPPAWTQTAPEKAKTDTSLEAWYYVADDAQEPPAPLPVIPDPVNPYGENTLHVGITGGQEESRTYVTLDVTDLPAAFKLVEGKLTMPIAPDSGTIGAEDARVQLCLALPPTKSTEGSFEEPPEVDCKTRSPAGYREKPLPRLEADLTPFEDDLAFSALAIVPSDRAVEQQDTWHIAFYGKKNETEGAKPISAELSFVEEELEIPTVDEPGTGDIPTGTSPDFDTGIGNVGEFGTSPGTSVGAGSAPSTSGEAADPAAAAVAQPQAQPTSLTRPGYNIVWGVPLLLVALYFYFGSALTNRVVLKRPGK